MHTVSRSLKDKDRISKTPGCLFELRERPADNNCNRTNFLYYFHVILVMYLILHDISLTPSSTSRQSTTRKLNTFVNRQQL